MKNGTFFVILSVMVTDIIYLLIANYMLRKDIKLLESEMVATNMNYTSCSSSLITQNLAIEAERIDYEAKIRVYERIQPTIVERVKVKYIKDANLTRGDCRDVKSILDNISNFSI